MTRLFCLDDQQVCQKKSWRATSKDYSELDAADSVVIVVAAAAAAHDSHAVARNSVGVLPGTDRTTTIAAAVVEAGWRHIVSDRAALLVWSERRALHQRSAEDVPCCCPGSRSDRPRTGHLETSGRCLESHCCSAAVDKNRDVAVAAAAWQESEETGHP